MLLPDSLNRLKLKALKTSGGTLSTEYFYKPSQRNSDEGTTKYTTTQLGREIVDNTAFTYYYDSVGNITRVLRSYKNMGVENTAAYKSYAYDTENQLIREDNKEANKTFVFDYDDLGNISSKTIYNHTSQGVTPTTAQKTIKYDYDKNGPNGWNHLLVGVDSDGVEGFGDNETITYDEIGNPEKYLGATLEWYGRQLQSYTKDGVEFTYTYDTDGLRATKDVNGVNYTYHYVGGQLRYETRGNEKFYYFYDASGVISGFRYVDSAGTAALYYTFTNSQGDVVAIYNQNGGWVGSYEYDAWGNVVKMVDGGNQEVDEENTTKIISKNAIRYRGYYYDEETKFYYLQSRYYNPDVGRFLNADGMLNGNGDILGYNMFAYCGNNPVNRADPTGEFWDDVKNWFSEKWNEVKNWANNEDDDENDGVVVAGTRGRSKNIKKPRKDPKKGSENRQKSGSRERNVGHPNGEEHSRVPKGSFRYENIESVIGITVAVVGITYIITNDLTGFGVIDDAFIIPFSKLLWDSATKLA